MTNLFEATGLDKGAPRPLADRLRPTKLSEVAGQPHLVGADGDANALCWKAVAFRASSSGARPDAANHHRAPSGPRDQARVRAAFRHLLRRRRGAQSLLPRQGATRAGPRHACSSSTRSITSTAPNRTASFRTWRTAPSRSSARPRKNPPFELNAALLSRATVLTLNRLDDDALEDLAKRAEAEEKRTAFPWTTTPAKAAEVDGRRRRPLAHPEPRRRSVRRPSNRRAKSSTAKPSSSSCNGVRRSTTRAARATTIPDLRAAQSRARLHPDAPPITSAACSTAERNRLFLARAHRAHGSGRHRARRSAGAGDHQRRKDAFDFLGSPEDELALAEAVHLRSDGSNRTPPTSPSRPPSAPPRRAASSAAKDTSSTRRPSHEGRGRRRRQSLRPRSARRLLQPNYFPDEFKNAPSSTTRPSAASSAS